MNCAITSPFPLKSQLSGNAVAYKHVDLGYDSSDQLKTVDYDAGWSITDESYLYDGNGNRTNNGFVTATGSHNRISTDKTFAYAFDAQGNRTAEYFDLNGSGSLDAGDTGVTEYEYDVNNRLVRVTDCDTFGGDLTQAVDHKYDLMGRWIGKQVDTDGDDVVDVTERYVYSNGQIIYRFVDEDADGVAEGDELANRYLWGPMVDQLLAQENVSDLTSSLPDDVLFALADNLNSVRDLARLDAGDDDVLGTADDTTVIVRHATYESFGLTVDVTNPFDSQAAPAETMFGFTGRMFESYTGLQQNLHRWYDFETGQWLSADPIEADTQNTYRYVGNNPTNNVDPSGLAWIRYADMGSSKLDLDPKFEREREVFNTQGRMDGKTPQEAFAKAINFGVYNFVEDVEVGIVESVLAISDAERSARELLWNAGPAFSTMTGIDTGLEYEEFEMHSGMMARPARTLGNLG